MTARVRWYRAIERGIGAVVASPVVVGAAYVLALAAWAGLRAGGVDTDIGDARRVSAVETFVERRFASELTRMKIGVVAVAIALGIVLGLVAELLLRLRHPAPEHPRRSTARAFVDAVLLVAALHGALLLWAMADTPQLYAAEWYARGGLARTVQVVVTDHLHPGGVVLLSLLGVIVFVRPSRIVVLGRRAAGHLREVARARFALLPLVLLLGGEVRAAPAPANAGRDAPFNVLILAADSLRADRLDPRVAPNLSRLADRGTRFDRAYVSIPRTFSSWVTILSGRHGHHHGIRSMFPTWEERARDFDALPLRFRKAGYETAVVSDYAGDIFGRIELGFRRVDTPAFDFRQVIRQKVLERETPLLPVLHSHLGRKLFPVMRELAVAADPNLLADDVEDALRSVQRAPFFMTVFFSTAHFPYAAPAPHYGAFTDPAYRGRFKYHKPLGLSRATEAPPDAADIRQIRALYDGAVHGVDAAMGRVLRRLERLGLAERTIVVVTADHGETLFDNEHGQGHGDTLFGDEATHVPLVVYDPRIQQGRRVSGVVRDVDLAPTLYELAAVPRPDDLDGRSLAPAMRGEPLDARFAYAETELWFTEDIPSLPKEMRMPYPGLLGLNELDSRHNAEVVLRKEMLATTLMARHRMIRDDRWKLVYVPTRTGVRWLLYDTERDPAETTDVAAGQPAEVARLKGALWSWMLEDRGMEQRNGYLVPREAPLGGKADR